MPFTFSHPAIVLPFTYLSKRWYSLSGLVIGSIVPDFEYFLRAKVKSEYSHTIAGLVLFDVPIGVVLFVLFHAVVRGSFVANLPVAVKRRIALVPSLDWRLELRTRWFIVVCSLFVGAASHLFWDSFTHADGYFVLLFPELRRTVSVFVFQMPAFKVLQHSSSILGLITISYVVSKLPKGDCQIDSFPRKYWVRVFLIAASLITIRFCIDGGGVHIGDLVVTAIAGILAALVLEPIIWRTHSCKYTCK